MGSMGGNGTNAVKGHAVEGTSGVRAASQPTGELVSELMQIGYQLRAWSGVDTPGWEQRAGVDPKSLRVRKSEVLAELRVRGLDFFDASSEHSVARPGDPAILGPEARSLCPQADADALAAQVGNLERGLLTRTVIGQAEGILMERYSLTAEEAFGMLRRASSVTNRKLCVIAAELVERRILAGVGPMAARSSTRKSHVHDVNTSATAHDRR